MSTAGRRRHRRIKPVPATFDQAMDPVWLTQVLRNVTGGRAISARAHHRSPADHGHQSAVYGAPVGPKAASGAFCLKAFLDADAALARGASVTITEADFYAELAPSLAVRLPACVAHVIDRPQAKASSSCAT